MKKVSIFSYALICLTLLTCVSFGYLFSNILLSTNIFQFSSSVTTETQIFYALSTKSGQTENELLPFKNDLQAQNGAGIIFEKDSMYFLLASIYENLPDAEKVKSNLSAQGVESQIVKIEVAPTAIDGNFSSEEKSILSACLKNRFEIYKLLYDVAISLDTEVFDLKNAKLECNNIFSKHIQTKTNLDTFFKDGSNEICLLKEELKRVESLLSKLIGEDYQSQNQTFSSLIKMTYTKILLKL